jgi:DNA modification methylase
VRYETPIALLRELIAQSSQPGELILDPFAGSGSTGHAARRLGRRAVIADIDATMAAQRLRLTPATRRPAPA